MRALALVAAAGLLAAGAAAAASATAQDGACAYTGPWRDAAALYATTGACASVHVSAAGTVSSWTLRADALVVPGPPLRIEACWDAGWTAGCVGEACPGNALCRRIVEAGHGSALAARTTCATVEVWQGASRLARAHACASP